MLSKTKFGLTIIILANLMSATWLLSACSPAAPKQLEPTFAPTMEATAVEAPAPTVESIATVQPEAPAAESSDQQLQFSMDAGSLASGWQTETVPTVFGGDAPYWEVLPQHTRVTLQGYPVSESLMQPVIYIYPLKELQKISETSRPLVSALQTLLAAPQDSPDLPFLPLINAAQVTHAHLEYLDFKSGQGLRYLTMFSQGLVPINNNELIYTYQGLTRDGKYYVAAVLPVIHPSLPADGSITGSEPPEFTSDFTAYVQNTTSALNAQAANTFTPDLAQLDAMLRSLEIQ